MKLPNNSLLQGGKYKIVRYISSGGFGCTYEAVHVMLDKRVAIKEFFPKDFCNRDETTAHVTVGTNSKRALVEKLRAKFVDEAKSLCHLSHPGIVKVSDVFEENSTAYYVMDYIDGRTVSEIVKVEGPMSEQRALKYIRQVADALRYVHGKNRLHLDIKPANIMIDKHDNAVLIDFGASKVYDEADGENTSTLLGKTPGYAPIEQLDNDVTHFYASTDIYALGATLYKMLSGITPPTSAKIASGTIVEPLPAAVSDNTRRAVAEAMRMLKEKRPQSIDELLDLLDGKAAIIDDDDDTVVEVVADAGGGSGNDGNGGGGSTPPVEPEKPEPKKPEPKEKKDTNSTPYTGKSTGPANKLADAEDAYAAAMRKRRPLEITLGILVPALLIFIFFLFMEWLVTKEENDLVHDYYEEAVDSTAVDDYYLYADTVMAEGDEDWSTMVSLTYDPEEHRFYDYATHNTYKLVRVPGGTFTMGGTDEHGTHASERELPTHKVTLNSYYIGESEVPQWMWNAVMSTNFSEYEGDELPVTNVNMEDINIFLETINSISDATFTLPTEAQWEYAARGGSADSPFLYSGSKSIGAVAWYDAETGGPHAVMQKKPNKLGLYDMSGNVWEWCSDYYAPYTSARATNPTGPSTGEKKVFRGGAWNSHDWNCRTSNRNYTDPTVRRNDIGFRIATKK